MMNNIKLCYVLFDRDEIANRILKYSEMNNPKKVIESFLDSSDPNVRIAAKNLLDSGFLNYFPLFVASIIAQESQFREDDNAVFGVNGKGVMQLTKSLTDDMIENPGLFNDNFIKRLKKDYNINMS